MGGIVSGRWESLGDIGYRQGVEFILREAYSANKKLQRRHKEDISWMGGLRGQCMVEKEELVETHKTFLPSPGDIE